ncbi:hypothetical protein [Rhizobium sp. BK251]|uniref:hypothetical protein n=1 Tax=Rhizobium sp. BK251 TaxID=2512125 RepID=UPI00104C2165|nr:hypothetical protein [Rhizobium sp. BK251]TCL73553.1 hypothetical protein EV286_10382 [Rhizobium sp. BK251]
MDRIAKRVVLHFPGFEPLDAKAHHARYARSAKQSAAVWGYFAATGDQQSGPAPYFDVEATGADWHAQSRIYMLDHNDLLRLLVDKTLLRRLSDGFLSAWRVAISGGLVGYFRHAWRFGLFFLFPFLLMALGLLACGALAALPWLFGLPLLHLVWSLQLAFLLFKRAFLPFTERFHTLHLFADWELAVALARLDNNEICRWLEDCAQRARVALREEADEYVITSHSMGSSVAAHVIGMLLEREPELFAGKRVVFATLGCAILQCALLRPAAVLRSRVGLIARCRDVTWLDVHCLTDSIHFYKVPVVAATGHADAPQPRIIFIRMKHMLTAEHYRRIKTDFLRVHRQYVLGPDIRAPFDFTLLTAGPLPAAAFAEFSHAKMPVL